MPGLPRGSPRAGDGGVRRRSGPRRDEHARVASGAGALRRLRGPLRRGRRAPPGPSSGARRLPPRDPADAAPARGPRRVPRARRHHRLPRRRLLRPPGPGRSRGSDPPLRGHHEPPRPSRGPQPAGRVELARHDDVGGRVRRRPPVGGPLPRDRLGGPARPGQVRLRPPHHPRRHPPRPRVGDPQPEALRHPRRQRELRRRLPGLVPGGRPFPGRRARHPRGPSRLRCRRKPRATWRGTRCCHPRRRRRS